MARGRLSSTTIEPYSSGKVYTNTSGNEASITLNAVVLDSTVSSEMSVGITTSPSLQTSSATSLQTACAPFCCITSFSICTDSNNPEYSGFYARPICTSCPACVTGVYFPNYIDSSGNVTSFVSRKNTITLCCQVIGACLYTCSPCAGGTTVNRCWCANVVAATGITTSLTYTSTLTNRNSYENPEFLLTSNICSTSDSSKFPVISHDCNGCVYYFKNTVLTTPTARAKHYVNPVHGGACTPTGIGNTFIASATDYWSNDKMTVGITDINYVNYAGYIASEYGCCVYGDCAVTAADHLLYPKWGYTWVNGSTVCSANVCSTDTPQQSFAKSLYGCGNSCFFQPNNCINNVVQTCCGCIPGVACVCSNNFAPGFNDFSSISLASKCGEESLLCCGTLTFCNACCCQARVLGNLANQTHTAFFVNESGPSVLAGCHIFAYQRPSNACFSCTHFVVGFIAGCSCRIRDLLSCACSPTTCACGVCTPCGSHNRVFAGVVCVPPYDPNIHLYQANPVKWMTYNPNTCCNYFMMHVGIPVTTCAVTCPGSVPCQNGIYSICHSTICNITANCCYSTACYCCCCINALARTHRVADDCCDWSTQPNCFPFVICNGMTPLAGCGFCCNTVCRFSTAFSRVGNLPSEIASCCFYCFCPSPLIRTGCSEWKFGVYENGAWIDYVSNDLTCWTRQCCYYTSGIFCCRVSDMLIVSCGSCIRKICDCFYSVMCNYEYLDYKDTANSYIRTGLLVSNNDSIYLSNNSSKQVSVQVWGYEG